MPLPHPRLPRPTSQSVLKPKPEPYSHSHMTHHGAPLGPPLCAQVLGSGPAPRWVCRAAVRTSLEATKGAHLVRGGRGREGCAHAQLMTATCVQAWRHSKFSQGRALGARGAGWGGVRTCAADDSLTVSHTPCRSPTHAPPTPHPSLNVRKCLEAKANTTKPQPHDSSRRPPRPSALCTGVGVGACASVGARSSHSHKLGGLQSSARGAH